MMSSHPGQDRGDRERGVASALIMLLKTKLLARCSYAPSDSSQNVDVRRTDDGAE